jgi:16S rRNA (cytosine1402-N4)-methyltransferase
MHVPVLCEAVVNLLSPSLGRGGVFVDGTFGLGGHTRALMTNCTQPVHWIGIDQDAIVAAPAASALGVDYLHGNVGHITFLLKQLNVTELQGILLDIGVSSIQIDQPERGFSFMSDGPLDMRMDSSGGQTVAQLLRRIPEPDLADILYYYGEERLARKIARRICDLRQRQPIERTSQLAELVVGCYPPQQRHAVQHPATRTFQALRIAVNEELAQLERAIPQCLSLLAPGGRFAVITFHSLEDRIVKHAFRQATTQGYTILTRKPVIAQDDEVLANHRSRSAKLRVIERNSQQT